MKTAPDNRMHSENTTTELEEECHVLRASKAKTTCGCCVKRQAGKNEIQLKKI